MEFDFINLPKLYKRSGIYKIKNTITGDVYIGSSVDSITRMCQHRSQLRHNKHHSPILQNSYNKYGHSVFVVSIICFCDINLLIILEQFYINSCKPFYNTATCADSPMKGRKHSKETLNKLKGRGTWNKGIPRTEEEKDFISKRRKEAANRRTPEQIAAFKKWHKDNPSRPFLGRHHTDGNKKIIRDCRIGGRPSILCIESGELFEAQIDITRKMGLRQGHISEHLQGKRPRVGGYTFKYLEESTNNP